jgi:purine-binding chemotaxis protein CheW
MSNEYPKNPAILHEPEQAIDNYLAALLSEVDEYHPDQELAVQPELSEQRVAEIVDFPTRVILPRSLPVDSEMEQMVEPVIVKQEEIAEITKVEATSADDSSSIQEMSVPAWAEQPFQCLLFKVNGVTMAVPLTALSSIAPWESQVTPIPGQPDWHLGVYLHRDTRVVVVDTAQLIMPDRMVRTDASPPKGSHILIIGDGRWGLACDSLQRPVTLDKQAVRWSKGSIQRPWMAGTVIDKLCILLNVDALLKMIRHD